MNIKYKDGNTFMHIRRLISPPPPPKNKEGKRKEMEGCGAGFLTTRASWAS